jgi:hypothetical protein
VVVVVVDVVVVDVVDVVVDDGVVVVVVLFCFFVFSRRFSFSQFHRFCKGVIKDILQNKVDLSLLIITKSYSRDAEDYKNPQGTDETMHCCWRLCY